MEIPKQLCWNIRKLKEVKSMKIPELENWTMLPMAGITAREQGRAGKKAAQDRHLHQVLLWGREEGEAINLDLTSSDMACSTSSPMQKGQSL